MKRPTFSLPLLALAFTFALAAPSHARRFGTEMEGTIQTVNLETKHATMLTTDGKVITFRWHETTQFTAAAPLRKGAHVKVEYHGSLFGESYVNRVDVEGSAKEGSHHPSTRTAR